MRIKSGLAAMAMALGLASMAVVSTTAMAQDAMPNFGGGSGPADPNHPGKKIYDERCGACHDKPSEMRTVPFAALRAMRHGTIHFALTQGKMKQQATGLNEQQLGTLIDFVVGRQVLDDAWIKRMQCGPERKLDLKAQVKVNGFGFDVRNTRALTREQSGLATTDFKDMELAWALAFPGATTMRSQPAVIGNVLFLPVGDNGRLFALNVGGDTPCIHWTYTSDVPLRSGVSIGKMPGTNRSVLVFNDVATRIQLLDAANGKLLWKTQIGLTNLSNATGTPVIFGDRVFAPLSASELNFGGDNKHVCCTTHGAFYALDLRTGRKLWTYHTMEDAKPVRDRGDGQMMWGPSGAPIWNSPLLDAKRGLIYVGTGESTSAPIAPTTDAVLALDMKTGKLRWRYQATPDDLFLTACMRRPNGLNCPKEGRMLDHDFGAAFIMAQRADGSDLLLAGQKSGMLWALNPDNGKLVWNREFGKGSPVGGIHWGMTYDGTSVYVPIHSFPGPDGTDPNQTPGLHAVRVDDGHVRWSYEAKPECGGDRPKRVPNCHNIGLTGAATLIDGAVVEGSADGFLRAFDAATGQVLFEYDTARTYDGINGIAGKGGGIDNASIVATNGLVFVNSGYGLMGGQGAGNVFLAFRRKTAH